MDVPVSPGLKQRRQRRRRLAGGGAFLLLVLATVVLFRLHPAAPGVEKSTLYLGTVKRGEMLRQVRGNGTLVPEDIRWLPTINAGRVEQILVLPGAAVKAETVLVELSNPDVEQAAFDAESLFKAAQADLANLRVQLASQKLTQQAAVASAEANSTTAQSDFEADDALGQRGLAAPLVVNASKAKAGELAKLLTIEQERLRICDDAARAQLAAQDEKITQLEAQLELKRRQVAALKVRAGMDGVLQRLGDPASPLQVGQQLAVGALVARVANMTRLKAAIKIPETQARDVQLDQPAEIDTRNGVIAGHVVRIDPAVEDGTVTVDVGLDGALPKGARPDLTVEGTIQLERLENVLYVGCPVQGRADSEVRLFKVVDGGNGAVRVPVKLGRCSVSTIEILDGLQMGDQIILSDMSQWDAHDQLRLN